MPSFRKAGRADALAFAAQRREPQDRGERAGDRQVRPEVDADQDGARHVLGHLRGLHGAAGDQAGRQIVHQVAGEREQPGRRPRPPPVDGALRRVVQSALRSMPISPVLSSASTSTNSPATSGSTPQEMSLTWPRALFASREQHDARRWRARDRGGQAELDVEAPRPPAARPRWRRSRAPRSCRRPTAAAPAHRPRSPG